MNTIEPAELVPEYTPQVIFRGAPSQAVNIAIVAKALVVVVAVLAIGTAWPVPPLLIYLAILIAVAMVAYRCLQTALTIITIDVERITVREGVFTKEISSLELFRIQDVTFLQPWWQNLLAIGTVLVHTSDTTNPRWRLYGMRNAERLRNELNRAAIAMRDKKGYRELNVGRV